MAQKQYPVGTQLQSAYSGAIYTVTDPNQWYSDTYVPYTAPADTGTTDTTSGTTGGTTDTTSGTTGGTTSTTTTEPTTTSPVINPDPTNTPSYRYEGQYALVKFSTDPTPNDGVNNTSTVWLYDTQNKQYRPLMSWEGLKNLLGGTMSDADIISRINIVSSSVLSDANWSGEFLPYDYGVQSDGTFQSSTSSSGAAGAQSTYGEQRMPESEEQIMNYLNVFFTTAIRTGTILQETFDEHLGAGSDGTQLAKYVSAMLYGEYSFGDMWRDLKSKELSAAGNSAYDNFKSFDDNVKAQQWYETTEGQGALTDSNLQIPPELNVDPSILTNPIFSISGNAFKTLIPPIDWNSPEFKERASEIEAAWFDIMEQKLNADTEQARAVADHNYALFTDNINRKYGIQLSNNAREAWNQIQAITAEGTERGIGTSGIVEEARDKHLLDIRRSDQILRDSKLREEELEFRNFLLTAATPEQMREAIAKMNGEDGDAGIAPQGYRSVLWGLVPSEETKNFFQLDNLREVYPELSDEELSLVKNMVIDDNGYFKSDLYQNLYSNRFDLTQSKKDYQEGKLYEQLTIEERNAYAPYTGGNPLSSYQPTGVDSVIPENNYSNIPDSGDTTYGTEDNAEVNASTIDSMPDYASQYGPNYWTAVMDGATYVNGQLVKSFTNETDSAMKAAAYAKQVGNFVGSFPSGYDLITWGSSQSLPTSFTSSTSGSTGTTSGYGSLDAYKTSDAFNSAQDGTIFNLTETYDTYQPGSLFYKSGTDFNYITNTDELQSLAGSGTVIPGSNTDFKLS